MDVFNFVKMGCISDIDLPGIVNNNICVFVASVCAKLVTNASYVHAELVVQSHF